MSMIEKTIAPHKPIETEEIAKLAYALWENRGYPEGSPEVDWYQAEQQLQAERDTLFRIPNASRTEVGTRKRMIA